MSDDIVSKLRYDALYMVGGEEGSNMARAATEIESLRREVASYQEEIKQWYGKLEAADDEVESLRRENERLREALERISTGDLNYPEQAARKALKGETE